MIAAICLAEYHYDYDAFFSMCGRQSTALRYAYAPADQRGR